MKTQLLVSTRFNVGIYSKDRIDGPSKVPDIFTKLRLELFKCATLLSVQSQTFTNFEWLIFIDFRTPRYLKDKIYELETMDDRIRIIETASDWIRHSFPTRLYLLNTIPYIDEDTDLLVQFKIDSDDIIKNNYFYNLMYNLDKINENAYICSSWKGNMSGASSVIQFINNESLTDLFGIFDHDHMYMSRMLPVLQNKNLAYHPIYNLSTTCSTHKKEMDHRLFLLDKSYIFDREKSEEIIKEIAKLREFNECATVSID